MCAEFWDIQAWKFCFYFFQNVYKYKFKLVIQSVHCISFKFQNPKPVYLTEKIHYRSVLIHLSCCRIFVKNIYSVLFHFVPNYRLKKLVLWTQQNLISAKSKNIGRISWNFFFQVFSFMQKCKLFSLKSLQIRLFAQIYSRNRTFFLERRMKFLRLFLLLFILSDCLWNIVTLESCYWQFCYLGI